MRDNRVWCSVHRSSVTTQDAGATLSVATQLSADNSDTSCATEQIRANKFDDGSVQHDNATVHSVSETSRRSSAAVELSCSVVDTVSRNRCSKTQTSRRKSLNEAAVADFSVAGLHDGAFIASDLHDLKFDASPEHCQRSAWRRTKSYDMSSCEVTVL